MSAVCASSKAASSAVFSAQAMQQKTTVPARSNVRDADGDFDGTKFGQVDTKDAGKGLLIDLRA